MGWGCDGTMSPSNDPIKIVRCDELSKEGRKVIESSYSDREIQQINEKIIDAKDFLVAKLDAKEVGVVAMKEELKEKPYLHMECLAVLPGEFWDDAILSLVKGARAYAAELGFSEIHIVESRDPYIEFLKRAGFQPTMEYLILERDLTSISQPKSQVVVKHIPGDVRSFVSAWNHIVSSGSTGDFPDFPPITEEYIREKLPKLDSEGWFIALRGTEPCGLITVSKDKSLGDLMVSKSYRRMGIGTALAIEALKYLKDKGSMRATLRVRAGNTEALRFYLHLGFVIQKTELDMVVHGR